MKDRISEFLKAENKSSAQMAEEIGVQPSGISHILSGRNKPSLDFVIKMLERYKYLSYEWLLFGKGSMYKEAGMQELFLADQNKDMEIFENKIIENNKVRSPLNSDESEEPNNTPRLTEKIVWFFKDGSFKEYKPE